MLKLKRRTFLRGMAGGSAVAVGLPTLDIMLNEHATALADGSPLPTCFGVWYWGNGIKPIDWRMDVAHKRLSKRNLAEALKPLAGVHKFVSVIGDAELRGARGHEDGFAAVLTGRPVHRAEEDREEGVPPGTVSGPTADQIAARLIRTNSDPSQRTPLSSLEVGIAQQRHNYASTIHNYLSHTGPYESLPPEYAPLRLYERLFALTVDKPDALTRVSVLDAVNEDVRALTRRVGAHDRARLEKHFEAVRAIERRLATGPVACAALSSPGEIATDANNATLVERNQIMSELLALALGCGLTRVFSVAFSIARSTASIPDIGLVDNWHSYTHNEPKPQRTVRRVVKYTMERLGEFLQTLRGHADGAGTLLDRCSILCTSDIGDGAGHRARPYPLLIAGLGGGRLKGGVHHVAPGANITRATLTALRGAGFDIASFGTGEQRATASFSELEQ